MRKITAGLLAMLMLAGVCLAATVSELDSRMDDTVVLQINNYAAAVDGELKHIYPGEKNVVPYIDASGRTMLPVRFIAEALEAKVSWDARARTVTIALDGKSIKLAVDGKNAVIPAHNRTMVPARFVAESLGKAVEWDESRRLVIITDKDEPWNLNGAVEKEATMNLLLMFTMLRDFPETGAK